MATKLVLIAVLCGLLVAEGIQIEKQPNTNTNTLQGTGGTTKTTGGGPPVVVEADVVGDKPAGATSDTPTPSKKLGCPRVDTLVVDVSGSISYFLIKNETRPLVQAEMARLASCVADAERVTKPTIEKVKAQQKTTPSAKYFKAAYRLLGAGDAWVASKVEATSTASACPAGMADLAKKISGFVFPYTPAQQKDIDNFWNTVTPTLHAEGQKVFNSYHSLVKKWITSAKDAKQAKIIAFSSSATEIGTYGNFQGSKGDFAKMTDAEIDKLIVSFICPYRKSLFHGQNADYPGRACDGGTNFNSALKLVVDYNKNLNTNGDKSIRSLVFVTDGQPQDPEGPNTAAFNTLKTSGWVVNLISVIKQTDDIVLGNLKRWASKIVDPFTREDIITYYETSTFLDFGSVEKIVAEAAMKACIHRFSIFFENDETGACDAKCAARDKAGACDTCSEKPARFIQNYKPYFGTAAKEGCATSVDPQCADKAAGGLKKSVTAVGQRCDGITTPVYVLCFASQVGTSARNDGLSKGRAAFATNLVWGESVPSGVKSYSFGDKVSEMGSKEVKVATGSTHAQTKMAAQRVCTLYCGCVPKSVAPSLKDIGRCEDLL